MIVDMSMINRLGNGHSAAQITSKVYNQLTGNGETPELAGEDFSFAAMLAKEEDKNTNTIGAADSIAIVKKQIGEKGSASFVYDGVNVVVETGTLYGDQITIGGTDNPEWISVSTSVGTVNIDMNDLGSVGKCLDLFSPEDQKKILEAITKYKMAKQAERECEEAEDASPEEAAQMDDVEKKDQTDAINRKKEQE